MNTVVLGSGAWGTALALLLCRAGHRVTLWNRDPEKAAKMERRRTNPRLPGASLPRELRVSASLEPLAEAELTVFAVPSYAVRETAGLVRPALRPGSLLVSAAKGVEPETCLRMTPRALLITRAVREAGELVLRAGGSAWTCAGLAGVGDLIVTCTSRHSRNRKAGLLLGQGLGIRETLEQVGAVVEGYYAADSVRTLSERLGVSMPICACVYDMLYKDFPPGRCLERLMGRSPKSEF